jgi:hypothetical protein
MNSRALFQTIIAVRGKNINVLCKDKLLRIPYKKCMKLMHNREVVSPGPHTSEITEWISIKFSIEGSTLTI